MYAASSLRAQPIGASTRTGTDGPASLERLALCIIFVLLLVAYGSIGRDTFFNRLNDPTIEDPIGAVLVYLRVSLSAAAVLIVFATASLNTVLESVPRSLALYILLALVSFIWAEDVKNVLRAALVLTALYVALPTLIHRLGRTTSATLLLHVIAVVVIVSTLLAILVPSIGTHTGLEAVQASHTGRWRGLFSHKNGLGPWGAFGAVTLLAYGRLMGGPWLYRMLAWGCAVLCLLFSGSATSLIGCLTMIIGYVFLRVTRAMGSGVAALVAIAGLFLAAIVFTVFADAVFGLMGRDATLTGRTEIWEIALDYIKLAPILGHGYQSLGGPVFLDFIASYTAQAIPGPENMYLASMLELGLVGTLLFFVPTVMAMIRAGRAAVALPESDDRATLEMMSLIVLAALFMGITESTPFVCTGFDGVVTFCALFIVLQYNGPSTVSSRTVAFRRHPASRLQRDRAEARTQTP